MKCGWKLAAGLCLAAASVGNAQEGEPPGREAPPPLAKESARPAGDVVTLSTGKQLRGVQVIKSTPRVIVVQPAENVAPLELPRALVASIEFDDYTPGRDPKPDSSNDGGDASTVILGEEISPELHNKLTKPLETEVRKVNEQDFVRILRQFGEQANVPLEFSKAVRGLPREARAWSFEAKPDMSLLHILQSEFSKAFPKLEWAYQYDKILVRRKQEEKPEPEAERAPAAE